MNMTLEEAKLKLQTVGQEHLLSFYEELSENEKENLLMQIESLDFSVVSLYKEKDKLHKKGKITPLSVMQLPEIEHAKELYDEIGMQAIKEGKVAAVLLAGGMGTRLGSDDPKGMYDIGKTKEVFIFQRLIENLMDVVTKADTFISLFVMTSDKNHKATTEFFEEHNYFGYKKECITFFMQEMAPATDFNGNVYLEEKGIISTSPNGNGGWFASMVKKGVIHQIHEQGIEVLNVFAVDNVLQRIADPVFIGAMLSAGCSSGSKVVKKNAPDEKVGIMCLEDGKPSIVEYYELTEELMNTVDESGNPAYQYGVILNYLFRVKELEEILEKKLELHMVQKKIAHINENGEEIRPEEPNGLKYEQLVLDMIHQLDSCLAFEVVRNKEFAPIKNKEGVDSVESAQRLLEENGIVL